MVQGIYQREGGGAIKGSAIIKGSGDANRRLVDIGDAEINFSHDEKGTARSRRGRRSPSSGKCFRGGPEGICRRGRWSSVMPQARTRSGSFVMAVAAGSRLLMACDVQLGGCG